MHLRSPSMFAHDQPAVRSRQEDAMGAMATALALTLLLSDFFSLAELRVLPSRDEPFGVTKVVSPEGHITAEWRKLMRNLQVELSEVKRCRAIPGECTRRARQF